MERWFIKNTKADYSLIAGQFGISPVLARLVVNRGAHDAVSFGRYLSDQETLPGDPLLMKDMDKARDILIEKIRERKPVRIMGDYDADGIMSVYILKKALDRCGASADFRVPDRIRDGYGLNEDMVAAAYQDGIDTILTCDNGISAQGPVHKAHKLGMTVIITDHHEIPYEERDGVKQFLIPEADAVVDPKQETCAYPYPGICGAAVALKLSEALYRALLPEGNALGEFAEFAAIATVCDVMDLTGENRALVKIGLAAIQNTANKGLQALIRASGLGRIGAYHLGFIIGPCINASGRLSTADLALRLLFSGDENEAGLLATELKRLNDERKELTREGVKKAISLIEGGPLKGDKVLAVCLPDCHESLAGIIAGRIRERYHRPVFIFTETERCLKGSGRSIEAYPMYDRLCECRDLLLAFGGHPMAAGLSLDRDKLEELRIRLNESCGLSDEDLIPRISFDMELPLERADKKLVRELALLEPYGKGNAKPLFAQRRVELVRGSVLGAGRNVIRLALLPEGDSRIYQAVLFQDAEAFEENLAGKYGESAPESLYRGNRCGFYMDILYYPEINEYRGSENLQLVIEHYRL